MSEMFMWELLVAVCALGAWYTYWSNGKAYDRGLIDAIKMHHEGRLTYKSYSEDGVEMLDLRIEPEDWDEV